MRRCACLANRRGSELCHRCVQFGTPWRREPGMSAGSRASGCAQTSWRARRPAVSRHLECGALHPSGFRRFAFTDSGTATRSSASSQIVPTIIRLTFAPIYGSGAAYCICSVPFLALSENLNQQVSAINRTYRSRRPLRRKYRSASCADPCVRFRCNICATYVLSAGIESGAGLGRVTTRSGTLEPGRGGLI
jgi:hypothetical protein